VDVVPSEALTLSVSAGLGRDDFGQSYFGLQEATFRNVSVSADYELQHGPRRRRRVQLRGYSGLQQSRSASPGDQEVDPNRNWTADATERVHYFSLYLRPPRFGATEARLSYDYSYALGDFIYAVGPALPAPSPLPETFNKLQDFRSTSGIA